MNVAELACMTIQPMIRGYAGSSVQGLGAGIDRPQKKRKTNKPVSNDVAAMFDTVLAILLGENEHAEAWKVWAAGPPTASPPCQIEPQHIDFKLLSQLRPPHYQVLQILRQHSVITAQAWTELRPTLHSLAAQVVADGGADGAGPSQGRQLQYTCTVAVD